MAFLETAWTTRVMKMASHCDRAVASSSGLGDILQSTGADVLFRNSDIRACA